MNKKVFVRYVVLMAGLIFLCIHPSYVVASEKFSDELSEESSEDFSETDKLDLVDSYYDNFYENVDIGNLEKELETINRRYGKNDNISFESIFSLLLEGKFDEAIQEAVMQLYDNIALEIRENSDILIKLILLVIVAAIFNTYSSVYKFSYVGEQGFFVTYIMIAVLLLQSFSLVYDLAQETIYYIDELIKCLLPALYMSLMMCSGLTTSHMVNSMFLWMISVIEKFLLVVVLPGNQIYFLIVLLNQISTEDRFSKLAGLIRQGLQFMLKAIVTGLVGLNVMKSILVPVYDNAKYNMLQKGLSVIPGGSSLSGLSTILVGAGVLIKNSVGVTVVIILLVLGSIPLLEILCFYIVYKVILAMVQPISDGRILKGIQGAADSTGILLRATTTSLVLSVLSIAIVIMTTNIRLYVG